MSEQELKEKQFIKIFQNNNCIDEFFDTRYPELKKLSNVITEAKNNYDVSKANLDKAKEVYMASSQIANTLLKILFTF
jgi:hypothetical protein